MTEGVPHNVPTPCNAYNFTCHVAIDYEAVTRSCTGLSGQHLDMAIVSAAIIIGITILLLNLVILWTARKKNCRTPINGLVYGLCIEDLLTALFIIPLFAASFRSEKIFMSPLCNLYGLSVVFMSMASGSTVCLISLLQTYAYLRPLAFRCNVRTWKVRLSSGARYFVMLLFVLPCLSREDFFFQYDSSGHLCTWNYNGHQHGNHQFNYLKFATWFYPMFGLLQLILMSASVTVASVLVVKARYILKRRRLSQKNRISSRGKAPNLAEGVLLSISYLVGVSFLIMNQVNDYLLPQHLQIDFMTQCKEWNVFKTSAIFLTSLLNQFAIGLKNRRIRMQLIRDIRRIFVKEDVNKRVSRSEYITFRLRSDTKLTELVSTNLGAI